MIFVKFVLLPVYTHGRIIRPDELSTLVRLLDELSRWFVFMDSSTVCPCLYTDELSDGLKMLAQIRLNGSSVSSINTANEQEKSIRLSSIW